MNTSDKRVVGTLNQIVWVRLVANSYIAPVSFRSIGITVASQTVTIKPTVHLSPKF